MRGHDGMCKRMKFCRLAHTGPNNMGLLTQRACDTVLRKTILSMLMQVTLSIFYDFLVQIWAYCQVADMHKGTLIHEQVAD